jgi:hypothetical protein
MMSSCNLLICLNVSVVLVSISCPQRMNGLEILTLKCQRDAMMPSAEPTIERISDAGIYPWIRGGWFSDLAVLVLLVACTQPVVTKPPAMMDASWTTCPTLGKNVATIARASTTKVTMLATLLALTLIVTVIPPLVSFTWNILQR